MSAYLQEVCSRQGEHPNELGLGLKPPRSVELYAVASFTLSLLPLSPREADKLLPL
jgi:hypothetical protein